MPIATSDCLGRVVPLRLFGAGFSDRAVPIRLHPCVHCAPTGCAVGLLQPNSAGQIHAGSGPGSAGCPPDGDQHPLVIAITFAYASILAGIAGVLLAPIFLVSQAMGSVGLKAYRLHRWRLRQHDRAVVGGLVGGSIEVLSASYVSSVYKDAIVFAVLIAFLLLRPQGLFGKKVIGSL